MRDIKAVRVGNCILNGEKIYIQSMLNKRSDDIEGNVAQAAELERVGCEILRVSIPDMESVKLIEAIKNKISIPLVADIHFDYRLALESAAAGIDKIRINPGNIGSIDNVRKVADTCRKKDIPIRIGVNSGSLEKDILAKYGHVCADALVESALGHVEILNRCDFDDIVISIKSSDVNTMIKTYRLAAEKCKYPLHLGVTEAGTAHMGLIKSSIGIGSLLCDGIGETIRVSLTGNPVLEIQAAKDILKAVRGGGIEVVSCPTCGRTRIDLEKIVTEFESASSGIDKNLKVAIMGCVVNGPGEAKEADIGVAGGSGYAVLFKKGKIIKSKIKEEDIVNELLCEIEKMQ